MPYREQCSSPDDSSFWETVGKFQALQDQLGMQGVVAKNEAGYAMNQIISYSKIHFCPILKTPESLGAVIRGT